jgi:hypothetical protein
LGINGNLQLAQHHGSEITAITTAIKAKNFVGQTDTNAHSIKSNGNPHPAMTQDNSDWAPDTLPKRSKNQHSDTASKNKK